MEQMANELGQVEQVMIKHRNATLAAMSGAAGTTLKMLRQRLQITSAILRGVASLIDALAPQDNPSATP